MRALTASPAPPTPTSTSTPAATSSARSSSRSTCRSCCGPSSRKPSWKHEHVALGTNTDPYQWVESRYKLMPGIWAALRDSGTPGSLVTKSPLVLRDLELLRELHEAAEMSRLPVGAHDRRARLARDRAAHPLAPRAARGGRRAERGRSAGGHPDRAADARHQRRSGAGRGDRPDGARTRGDQHRLGRAAPARRGARHLLRRGCATTGPDLIPRYEEIYARGAYAVPEERKRLAALVKTSRRRPRPKQPRRGWLSTAGETTKPAKPKAAAPEEQPSLF